jgi:hypothetical protein
MIRHLLRLTCAVALIVNSFALPARAAQSTFPPQLSAKLDTLFATAYDETMGRHVVAERDGTTYVSTGDIQAEWLRDASATVRPYIGLARHDEGMARTLRGVIQREARYILIDPYANAYSPDYHVVEQKFEMDSLLYPVWFAAEYYRQTGDTSLFTPTVRRAFDVVLATLRTEQHHDLRSHYTNPQLARGGRGSAVRYTGMVWTGFRPSDDPVRYHYNIPDNMFAVVVQRLARSAHGGKRVGNVDRNPARHRTERHAQPRAVRPHLRLRSRRSRSRQRDGRRQHSLAPLDPIFRVSAGDQLALSRHAAIRALRPQPVFLSRQVCGG